MGGLLVGSSLSDAGQWASIAAALFAFLLIVAGVARWTWRRYHLADNLDLALCKDKEGAAGRADESGATLGLKLKNGSVHPLSFLVEVFTVDIEGQEAQTLGNKQAAETIGPSQTTQWLGPTVEVDNWPARAVVTFRVVYGPRRRKALRALEGGYVTLLPRALALGETFSGTWDSTGPDRDEKLPRDRRVRLR